MLGKLVEAANQFSGTAGQRGLVTYRMFLIAGLIWQIGNFGIKHD
tara:strand:- start:402 stop:536 length:135 start_codon:yes stop_codon:yes gene_type:complete